MNDIDHTNMLYAIEKNNKKTNELKLIALQQLEIQRLSGIVDDIKTVLENYQKDSNPIEIIQDIDFLINDDG